MLNKATGVAAAANRPTVVATGWGGTQCRALAKAPASTDQGMGFLATPIKAWRTAR